MLIATCGWPGAVDLTVVGKISVIYTPDAGEQGAAIQKQGVLFSICESTLLIQPEHAFSGIL